MDSHTNKEIFKSLPKAELHAHLNGSISMKTIQKLLKMNNEVRDQTPADFVLQEATTMEEVFKLFPLIQSLTEKPEALRLATLDVIQEFSDDGVVYLELRTTPKQTKFMTKNEYVSTIIDAIKTAKSKSDIVVMLILSIDRRQSIEEAENTVDIAINDKSDTIVGVELSGNPIIDGRKFIPVLQKARNIGLGISVHLAEMEENDEEILDFLNFKPDRIGHGTFLHTKPEYVKLMEEYKIPLEICLTSNEMCKTTPNISDSHFPFWKEKNIPIAICTDDKGLMSNCCLSQEFQKAAKTFQLEIDDLKRISRESLRNSFADRKLGKESIALLGSIFSR